MVLDVAGNNKTRLGNHVHYLDILRLLTNLDFFFEIFPKSDILWNSFSSDKCHGT